MKNFLLFSLLLTLISCQKDLSVDISRTTKSTTSDITAQASFGVCDYDFSETTLTSTGWTKIFEDNFDAGLTKWNIWTGGAYNNELQLYQGANCQIANGILSIVAKKETVTGPTLPTNSTPKTFNYTSGRLESKTNFSASRTTPKVRMIARLKLPSGYGMWPAFWSYGDPWPTQGEIDIMEAKGQEPFSFYTNYFYGRRSGVNLVQNASAYITSSVSLQDCWHVFEVVWTSSSLTYYLDGQVVDTKTGGYISNLYGKIERITLNLAVGGDFFGSYNPALIVPGTYQIDYVKVFKSN